jgi:hypothetical protein
VKAATDECEGECRFVVGFLLIIWCSGITGVVVGYAECKICGICIER